MGKLIYQPKGKAREYSPWACNLYNGCSNRCTYCYNRKGVGCSLLGKDEVTPKKDASLATFTAELRKYREQILADGKGLFFNFVSDPFLDETWELNYQCATIALSNQVSCVFLSKKHPNNEFLKLFIKYRDLVKVGFTLTGCDELEPNADTNECRIEAIRSLSTLRIKSWASIEPVIDVHKAFSMIDKAYDAGCKNFKVGLLSGKRCYDNQDVAQFKYSVETYFPTCTFQWKDSVLDAIHEEDNGQLHLFEL